MLIQPTRWDEDATEERATLSDDGLTYSTHRSLSVTARSTFGAASGRWYWELRVLALAPGAQLQLGVMPAHSYSGPGAPVSDVFSGGSLTVGDVLGVALDLDAGTVAITRNGAQVYAASGLLAEGVGTVWYAALAHYSSDSTDCEVAANFGASAFVYPPPAGHATGWGEVHQPFLALGEPAMLGAAFGAWLTAPSVLSPPIDPAVRAFLAAPSVLNAADARLLAFTVALARLLAPSVLASSDVRILASATYANLRVSSILSASNFRASGWNDFTRALGDPTTLFVMDLVTPTGSVRVPISSWQATLQTGSSNYVQCVIPACSMWTEAINAAAEFVIYRRAVLPSGKAIEYEMARAPAGQTQFDRGPQRHTCTLSGYSDAFADSVDPPPAAYDRTLSGVRSISSGKSYRVRCAVDWLLRPGHRAFVSGAPLIVKFINYYVPSEWDSYMDVGG